MYICNIKINEGFDLIGHKMKTYKNYIIEKGLTGEKYRILMPAPLKEALIGFANSIESAKRKIRNHIYQNNL